MSCLPMGYQNSLILSTLCPISLYLRSNIFLHRLYPGSLYLLSNPIKSRKFFAFPARLVYQ